MTFAVTTARKPIVEIAYHNQKLKIQLRDMHKNDYFRGLAKERFEGLVKNFNHVDRCYNLHGTSEEQGNFHV